MSIILALGMLKASSEPVRNLPPDDALARYTQCVSRMALARAGNDPADKTAQVTALACENLLNPAVDEIMKSETGSKKEARRRVAALLEAQARREALAKISIANSYEKQIR